MTVEPLGNVVITAREIYDAVVRLTGRVDVLIEQQNTTSRDLSDHEKAAASAHQDFESRLRSLERSRWPLPSLAAVMSLAALGVSIVMLMMR